MRILLGEQHLAIARVAPAGCFAEQSHLTRAF